MTVKNLTQNYTITQNLSELYEGQKQTFADWLSRKNIMIFGNHSIRTPSLREVVNIYIQMYQYTMLYLTVYILWTTLWIQRNDKLIKRNMEIIESL